MPEKTGKEGICVGTSSMIVFLLLSTIAITACFLLAVRKVGMEISISTVLKIFCLAAVCGALLTGCVAGCGDQMGETNFLNWW
jgi:hypothetical protein